MGGLFGVISAEKGVGFSALEKMFYGTDYHSHLGTKRGGMASFDDGEFFRYIHDISNTQFRSKFDEDIGRMRGQSGIGVISDYEDQPLVINSHLGRYAIVSVNRIINLDSIVEHSFQSRKTHFAETGKGEINPTEIIATLINQERDVVRGIESAQEAIKGSCSLLLLTPEGIYAARDSFGRTPLIIGKKQDAYAIASETTAFPDLGFEVERDLGPGEIVFVTPNRIEQKREPNENMQICSFLWVYYGYPSSNYEGINVEKVRNRCGAALARADKEDLENGTLKVDLVAAIPDSGTGHAIGYSNESGIDYARPFVKYTPTWPRSFMPPDQEKRDLIARMKLVPIKDFIKGKHILFCEDSIVRGTQLKETVKQLFEMGAKQIHMRPACPPLIYGCDFLNFSRSRSANDLAGQKAIRAIEGIKIEEKIPEYLLSIYKNPDSSKYKEMVERIRVDLGLTTLRYQRLDKLVEAIGLPKNQLCTHCWDGNSFF